MDKLLSVVVPAYNEQTYIRETLNSICAQTYANLEIILVDDGSTDVTGEIMDEFAERDSRVKVIHKTNGGSVLARKAGVSVANGEYLTFVDGDDWVEPNAYQEMMESCTEADIIIAGHIEDTGAVTKHIASGVVCGSYEGERLIKELYPNMLMKSGTFMEWGIFPALWNKVFRRTFIEPFVNGVDETVVMGDDACVVYPAMLAANRIYVMDKFFYHYRRIPGSLTGEVPLVQLERRRFESFYKYVKKQFEQYKGRYDALNDWQKYMLFAMVPRADQLYQGYEELYYLYPFPQVKKDANIVLYAAGTYGQRLYKYLKRSGFCNVVLWADQNFEELQKMGLPVESPDRIAEVSYDYIVLALSIEKTRKAVAEHLKSIYPEEKVVVFDEELIFSEESQRAFGLLD